MFLVTTLLNKLPKELADNLKQKNMKIKFKPNYICFISFYFYISNKDVLLSTVICCDKFFFYLMSNVISINVVFDRFFYKTYTVANLPSTKLLSLHGFLVL